MPDTREPRNSCEQFFSENEGDEPILVTKAFFDKLAEEELFKDGKGPFKEHFGDREGDPYNPWKQLFGILHSGKGVFAEINMKSRKLGLDDFRTQKVNPPTHRCTICKNDGEEDVHFTKGVGTELTCKQCGSRKVENLKAPEMELAKARKEIKRLNSFIEREGEAVDKALRKNHQEIQELRAEAKVSRETTDKARLAYLYLNIVTCSDCNRPKTEGRVCPFCQTGGEDEAPET